MRSGDCARAAITSLSRSRKLVPPHKAAQQQITVVGFNGTTGALPVANDTSFFIKIRKNDNDAANRSQPMSLFAQFKTDATAATGFLNRAQLYVKEI